MRKGKRLFRLLAAAGAIGALAMTVALMPRGTSAHPASDSARSAPTQYQHIFIIMMENTGYDSLIGNPNAPWINSAAATYGVATNYYGVTHPSQPNYIAATSGSTNGVVNDNDTTVDVPNIVDQLEAQGKTWKAYMQSLSLCTTKLDHACGDQLYERKHNPFVSYQDIGGNASTSPVVPPNAARMANIVDFGQFATDLAANPVPSYVWISPDQCHDMHGRHDPELTNDRCDFSDVSGLVADGDAFLSDTVGKIMGSRAWTENSAIFVTWDESDFTGSGFQGFGDDSGCCDSPAGEGGGHVLTIVISSATHAAHASPVAANHYSLLSTVETAFGLGCLANTCDTAHVRPMRDLFDPLVS